MNNNAHKCNTIQMACLFRSFGRRRVVIRKGHVAQRFYFVFSGSVCVTIDDDEHSAFVKPTTLLRRGDHFGVCHLELNRPNKILKFVKDRPFWRDNAL